MDQLADTFALTLVERWAEDQEPIPIAEGELVQLLDDGEAVLLGYVDTSNVNYGGDSHEMTVEGRSKLGDLVDCAAFALGGQFTDQRLENIARRLVSPFGITVTTDTDTGDVFRRFALEDGETVHEALERLARARGVLLMSNAIGQLVVTRASEARRIGTPIELGRNVEAASRRGSVVDRFATYTVLSQNSGDDDWNGRSAAHISATAKDGTVGRYRPTRIIAEAQVDKSGAQRRADWERNIRAGRSQSLTYTLRGWRDDDGDLWEPNTIAHVVDEFARVDDDLLITSVALTEDDGGRVARLTMTRPEAYEIEGLPTPSRKPGQFW
jgi:prophage tail gpP-like protein